MYVELSGAYAFLLIYLRMLGLLTFNPLFSRQNVPVMVRTGLAFFAAILMMNQVSIVPDLNPSLLQFLYHGLFELGIGFMAGLVMNVFLSVLVVGGETIDMQIGISMAKAFDPSTNAQISITASLLNMWFYLVFFVTNSHHTFMRLAAYTFYILPLGGTSLNPDAFYNIAGLLSTALTLAVKLATPLIVIEVIVTMAVGIIMKVVPQINVFAVNIQFKLIIGLLTLFILVPSITGFLENLITLCFEQIGQALLTAR